MATLQLDPTALHRMCKQGGIKDDAELADLIGVSPSYISRVRAGNRYPSNQFIAGTLAVFGRSKFRELYAVVG